MRRGLVAATVVVVMAAVGCGAEKRVDAVIAGTPPATPYDGPLHVPHKEVDEDGVAAMTTESGAAGMALECDGEIYSGGGGPGGWGENDGGDTPEEGLEAYFDIEVPDVPRDGYRMEREEKDRVLFSYDVDGKTKVAVIVAKDRKNSPGWGPETSASCDPAELPASYTDSRGHEIWTDGNGRRVPTTTVSTHVGPEHCDWQQAHFLSTGGDADDDGRLYGRDPEGVLPDGMLTSAYDGDVRMPEQARDTGYRYENRALWLVEGDPSKAYVRTPDGVEMWPEVAKGHGCA
ncbi:hypothetical protein Sipo8835_21080 [Streptomyces ipomoeae]|jgi:hypothetical protein|uniref:Lipoprotein n=2 Tax=Streptomyces ipomoeae TaxID=103232 RepID=A0AAE8W3D2_9ACTN|nr:hypothetical protein [Streptomyces ipomoeae]EKX62384.1 putative lipoprotein [Streptomyces ipomoeae 91-03]MDX2694797.1 hypothetical protein [Streptomyces ipomoeae]MDX2821679.1 hypothetical protein [Streptomyces ipomoeae]MDX2840136.1 hypothetical protein [Streptomyces ipomoeae]MDX2874336.1 hypothetical protein [Streptomyces ipomoeae]